METKERNFKFIIGGVALILCIFFFTLPLVQCSEDSSLNATGWEIATGTGDLYDEAEEDGDFIVFILLIIPIVLLVLALIKRSFIVLLIVSLTGLIAKIIFIIGAFARLSDFEGAFELTAFNWIVLVFYLCLCVFTFYCKRLEAKAD